MATQTLTSEEMEIHVALKAHEWLVLDFSYTGWTFTRRICRVCKKVEWQVYGIHAWYDETSQGIIESCNAALIRMPKPYKSDKEIMPVGEMAKIDFALNDQSMWMVNKK